MKVKQRVKKALSGALIFAMVLVLSTTTLAQAYATYVSIKVEHVWKDDDPDNTENPADNGLGSETFIIDGENVKVTELWSNGEKIEVGDQEVKFGVMTDWRCGITAPCIYVGETGYFYNTSVSSLESCQITKVEIDGEPVEIDGENVRIHGDTVSVVGKIEYDIEIKDTDSNDGNSYILSGTTDIGVTEGGREYADRYAQKLAQEAVETLAEQMAGQMEQLKQLKATVPERPVAPVAPSVDSYETYAEYEQAMDEHHILLLEYMENDRIWERAQKDYDAFRDQMFQVMKDRWCQEYEEAFLQNGLPDDLLLDSTDMKNALQMALTYQDDETRTNLFWKAFAEELDKYVTGGSVDSGLPDEQAKQEIKNQVMEQLNKMEIPDFLSQTQLRSVAQVVAQEISARIGEDAKVDSTWVSPELAQPGSINYGKVQERNPLSIKDESIKALEEEGFTYNELMKITITVIESGGWLQAHEGANACLTLNGSGYRTSYYKTYVSTDNGETWTLVGATDQNGKDIEMEGIGEKTDTPAVGKEQIVSYLYTYLHVRNPNPDRFKEDPKDPDPKPDPKPSETPDPTPTPDPGPDPSEEPDPDPSEEPGEEIPEPDVPLGEPETPEEPVEEIEEPDVPLADIPETGDISDLWYGAALLAAAGLAILLCQERRNKKTA